MIQPVVHADGMTYPMNTFIDAYGFSRWKSEWVLPGSWRFSALLEDGSVAPSVDGHEIPALRPVAIRYIDGGGKDAAWGFCSCGDVGVLIDGECNECRRHDEDDDDEGVCPHCGGHL